MFGPGVTDPAFFSHAPELGAGCVRGLELEAVVRFPWAGGRHPCLDALITDDACLIGVESKRYEPVRGKARPSFSEAFERPVWAGLDRHDEVRRKLISGEIRFSRLDAGQLIKHALGLSAEAERRGLSARLIYLYAEPAAWPDGARIDLHAWRQHHEEVEAFALAVAGDSVMFTPLSYRAVLTRWAGGSDRLTMHARAMLDAFDL